MLPFHLSFDPSARGIGVVQEGRGFAGWLRDELLLFGSLAALVAWAYAGRLMATRRPGRNAVWIAGRGGVRAARCSRRSSTLHVALLAVALLIALGALFSTRVEPRRAAGLAARRRRRRVPARARSCSTSATSSTAGRSTA